MSQESVRVTTAVLLAAGTGSRLKPLTNDAPKCLTEVSGISMLERQVCCLRQHGFKRLIVVVGHLRHGIQEFLGKRRGDLTIDYVFNPQYHTTNNIYSLYLVRKEVREPFLLIECDLVFDPSLLEGMLCPDRIAVSRILPWMNGTTVSLHGSGQVKAFHVGSDAPLGERPCKTVNIYSFSPLSWRRIAKRLDQRIAAGKVNDYYETVFADMVAAGSLSFEAVFFDTKRWYEVDSVKDLRQAERMFPRLRAGRVYPPTRPRVASGGILERSRIMTIGKN